MQRLYCRDRGPGRFVMGVRVIEVAEASKVAALNAGDRAASKWPRVYLDADIELPVEALYATLETLHRPRDALCAASVPLRNRGCVVAGSGWPPARNRLPQASHRCGAQELTG